jgi:4-hydroxy-tetrahydrodipicolinate synthase
MKLFTGVYTALVTPFYQGKIDFPSLENLITQQLGGGIAGFVVNGTTAESPTLTEDEAFELLTFVKGFVKDRAHIIFGSGSNSTEKTIQLSKKAQDKGAEGLLVVVPYYNKPPQAGLAAHFKKVAESVSLPIMLYNVPGRTVTSLSVDTIAELSKVKNIVGIKEATGNVDFGRQIILSTESDFIVSSGDDETALELKVVGGQGTISVCSHIIPQWMCRWFHQDYQNEFGEEFLRIKPLISSLYITSNPIPVKAALKELGLIRSSEVRLPLCPMTAEQEATLIKQITAFKEMIV